MEFVFEEMQKKWRTILGVLTAVLWLLLLAGCGSAGERENTAYQFSITQEAKALVPYRLAGEEQGWKIECRVREASEAEKEELLEQIRQGKEGLQQLYRSGKTEMEEEQYQLSLEQYDQQEAEVLEKTVYFSEIAGAYTGGENPPAGMMDYCLQDKEGRTLVRGSVEASSQRELDWETPWYRSAQTDGAYFTSFFIPPEENARMELSLEGAGILVSLTLEKGLD